MAMLYEEYAANTERFDAIHTATDSESGVHGRIERLISAQTATKDCQTIMSHLRILSSRISALWSERKSLPATGWGQRDASRGMRVGRQEKLKTRDQTSRLRKANVKCSPGRLELFFLSPHHDTTLSPYDCTTT